MTGVYTWTVSATYSYMRGSTTVKRDLPAFIVVATSRVAAEAQGEEIVRGMMDALRVPHRSLQRVRRSAIRGWRCQVDDEGKVTR